MDKQRERKAMIFAFGMPGLLVSGLVGLILAGESKEIPDHSGFQSCRPCHAEIHEMWETSNHSEAISRIVRYDSTAEDCEDCHFRDRIKRGPHNTISGGAGKGRYHKNSCLSCHDPNNGGRPHMLVKNPEKLCEICHSQRDVFWGVGAKGIEDSRNFHSGVPCVSCHMNEGNHRMKVIRPDDSGLSDGRLDTCTACHKDDNREARVRQIQEWQGTYEESMAALEPDIKIIDEALKANPNLLDADLKSKFDDVKANLSILEKDGSRGFHNFIFSLEIMSLAAEDLKEIKAAAAEAL